MCLYLEDFEGEFKTRKGRPTCKMKKTFRSIDRYNDDGLSIITF